MEEKVHVVKNTTKIIPTIKGEVRLWKMTSKLTKSRFKVQTNAGNFATLCCDLKSHCS